MGSINTQSPIFTKSNIIERSYDKWSMQPSVFMGSKSGNTYHIMILVGAEVENVQENYYHFDTIQSISAKW